MDPVEVYRLEKRRAWQSMFGVALISIVSSFCLLSVPLYLFQVYDRVLTTRSFETLIAITTVACVVLIAYAFLETLRQILLARIGVRFESGVAGIILAGELAQQQGASSLSLHHLSEIRKVISSNLFPSLFDLPVMVLFLAIVFLIHPVLGIIVFVGMVLLIGITILGEWMTGNEIREAEETAGQARRTLDSHLRQQELIRALGLYPQTVSHWGKKQARHLTSLLRLGAQASGLSSSSKAARQLIQVAMIGGGAVLVITDQVTGGVIFATSVVASRALAPIEAIVSGWRQLKQGSISLKALDARIESFKIGDRYTPLPRPSKRLVADRVVYVPTQGAQPILKGISGAVDAGQTIAIVGQSGAGKSTLARILVGYLEPSNGQVLLDGQNLKAWDPVSRGMHMGYLPQAVGFFDGTIRENIARMRIDDPADYAIEAAQFVGVHDMIMRFPKGYDTMISEGGFQPSGGQKQLLGLARAYYGGPAFVVLDEPNASLDGEGEQILFSTLKKGGAAGIATIVVTQRLSLLKYVDKVLVLKDGVVESYGDPDTVMPGTIRAVASKAS